MSTRHTEALLDCLNREDYAGMFRIMVRYGLIPLKPLGNFKVGDIVYIEMVKYWIGEIVYIDDEMIAIKRAVWIASTGRFHEAFDPAKGFKREGGATNAEWEQMGNPEEPVFLGRESILTLRKWFGPIPTGTNA